MTQLLLGMQKKGVTHTSLVEMQTSSATVDEHLVISRGTRHALTTRSRHHPPRHLPQRDENMSPQNLSMTVYNRFIYGILKVATIKLCFGVCAVNTGAVHQTKGPSDRLNGSQGPTKNKQNQNPSLKRSLYDFIYVTLQKL